MPKEVETYYLSLAILEAFDAAREPVLKMIMPYFDYYEELHPLIDDDEYRRERNIRYLHGQLYNDDAKLVQDFQCEYDATGAYIGGRTVHEDGTVTENRVS